MKWGLGRHGLQAAWLGWDMEYKRGWAVYILICLLSSARVPSGRMKPRTTTFLKQG